jgi:hypothetical protein
VYSIFFLEGDILLLLISWHFRVDQSFRAIAIQAVDHFPKTGYPIFRFAASSLDYDDTTTAVDYLQKALRIIQTGKE